MAPSGMASTTTAGPSSSSRRCWRTPTSRIGSTSRSISMAGRSTRRPAKDERLKPLWVVPALAGREPDGRVVAWAREREDGGRGFGTTCGHFYDNWKHEPFRKLILNAIAWTAKVEVPAGGVEARFFTQEEITRYLEPPIRVLLLAGNDAHKWHNWEKTTVAIRAALEQD